MSRIIMMALTALMVVSGWPLAAGAVHGKPVKVADNLYEITYEDYDIDYALKPAPIKRRTPTGAGCSSVRNGNFFGRSFDYVYADCAEFVVRTRGGRGRYASIGVASTFLDADDANIERGLDEDTFDLMPMAVVDGINEKGVVCNLNVVPALDLDGPTTGTRPGGRPLNMEAIVRFVLDNAASARKAVTLLTERDIRIHRDYYGVTRGGFELHLMVADEKDTFVVEFVGNRMNVMEDANVMTNYYLGLNWMTPHACGIERYDILGRHRDEGNSMEGMAKLMERVAFTDSYRLSTRTSDLTGYNGVLGVDVTNENMEKWKEKLLPLVAQLSSRIREWRTRKENPTGFWITMHMSVYDIARRQLRVIVQERYGEPHFFTIEK